MRDLRTRLKAMQARQFIPLAVRKLNRLQVVTANVMCLRDFQFAHTSCCQGLVSEADGRLLRDWT